MLLKDEYISAVDDSPAAAEAATPTGGSDQAEGTEAATAAEIRRSLLFPKKNEIISADVKYNKNLR